MTVSDSAIPTRPAADAVRQVDLAITGMTCASCAQRIERKLNKVDGVSASVNYATERARVLLPVSVGSDTLLSAVAAAGYRARIVERERPAPDAVAVPAAGPTPLQALRFRLLISAALSLPVVLLAMVPAWQFANWQWLSLVLAAPVVVWGGWAFHRAAWTNLRHGAATMDTLVSLGTAAALGWSVYALFFGHAGMTGMRHPFTFAVSPGAGADAIYLEAAAGVTTFLLAGRYAEARSKRRAGAALRALLELGAKEVSLLRGGREHRLPVDQLAVGDEFVVRPGERLAADGEVVEGSSALDVSPLTGESVPREVGPGDVVAGGSVDVGGRLVVRATRVGQDTQLAQMARLVEEAQNGKAQVQRLADRIAGVFVPIVLVLALGTLAAWLLTGNGVTAAFTAAVAVLIIACPCALGLATPTALMVGTGRAAQLGIVIRGPEVLESTRRVDTVVLDKTGTVTTGALRLDEVVPADGVDPGALLRVAGALEAASEHPVGRAVAAAARGQAPGGDLPAVTDFANQPGLGVQGVVEGHAVVIGRPALLEQWSLTPPAELHAAQDRADTAGLTAVVVAWDGAVRGLLVVGDTVKPTSAAAVRSLRELGLRPVLLTGDSAPAARAVAEQIGIEPQDVIAGVLPVGKAAVITDLQAGGAVVAMIGDGVNDAAALATADLGIALGTGTDVAIEAADLTLVRGDLRVAVDAIALSRRTLRVIQGNLFWAFAYNVAALPVAALGLLNPMLAGAAMALSSVFVVTNSLRLRRFRGAASAG